MKESDYTSIKEKVVSLENGLQAIGLAQDAKAKEDRENLVARNRMASVRNLGYLLDGMRARRVLSLLFLWKERCNETKLEENCEARVRDAESRSAASLNELTSRVQSLTEEAEKKEEEHRATLYKARSDASLRAIESIAKLEQAFVQWMRLSKQEQFAEKATACEKQLTEANTAIERTESELKEAREKAENEKAELEKKYQQDMRDYEDLRMESAKTRSALESLLQDKEAAEERNRQLAKQIEQLGLSMATFQEAANGSEDDKQAIVARLQLQVNDLENRLAQSQKDEEEYRRKWELLQDFSADELTRAQKKIDELTATCSELIKQVEDANNQEHMMALVQEKEQLESKIHEMEIQFEATVDVVNNSSQIAVQRENQIDDLKGKIAGLEKKLEEVTQQKEALEKALEEAQQKQVESDATISGMEKSNTALKEEVMKMKRRVLALKNMEENMQDVEDLLQQRETQLKDVLERIKKAEKTSEFCRSEVKRYEALNAELEHRMSNYLFREGQAGEVLEKIVEKQVDRPETLEKVSELEKTVESLREEIVRLENTLKQKTDEEARQKQAHEAFKLKKVLPLKFFPIGNAPEKRTGRSEDVCG
ncbi:uncharacterized protein [Blastocystis hominis]|uniref:Uncharacterized protein n=1 Tax=Blastocystis hominis TaxID=12968 RepID=D8MBC7_BLAHO|nr:uncharacterized protein [Blastocystis hominis]CBK25366.2 unnamed protein product [Blastocystis hominis]|eukprot:XP_012899414.1 uncharacterized protein [Blastocystis hominis]